MPYVEGRTIHDADSHVMELPDKILEYVESQYKADLKARIKPVDPAWVDEMTALHEDPDFRAGAEDELMTRRNHKALGAFRAVDRSKTLDYLGFASQLVFTTSALSNYGLETGKTNALAIASARAHNRMMADFCSVDKRLLATGYVPLLDIEQAPVIAREAIDLGCKAIMIPSTCPPGHSPSHIGLDALYGLVEEAGLPILFHVGGEDKMNLDYTRNGGPQVLDFHGGAENFTGLTYMSIPLALWQTLSVLIMDGVFDRFENLKFGAIELGASWVPSWMRFIDSGTAAFAKGEERLQKLSAKPSEIAQRQFRVTPYPHEPTDWIIQNTSPDMCLFSSDFPHIEGGRNPLKRFGDALQDISQSDQNKFYRDNFIDLMGAGLAPELHDLPGLRNTG
jgi:predicted TIM-barrel fold metal-dependent hydrolase